MNRIVFGLLAISVAVFALSLSGCGTASDRPELGLVTGTIKLDHEPLTGVVVVFHPEDGRPARGKTDQDGNYALTYIGKTPGSKVGRNRVEIAPNEEGEDDSEESGDTETVSAARRPERKKIKVPARYNSKSELQVDVQSGKNVFDFNLDSRHKPHEG